jgi:hypothetical protein
MEINIYVHFVLQRFHEINRNVKPSNPIISEHLMTSIIDLIGDMYKNTNIMVININ